MRMWSPVLVATEPSNAYSDLQELEEGAGSRLAKSKGNLAGAETRQNAS